MNLTATEQDMLNSVVDDFNDLMLESFYNKKFYVKDLKNIIILAAELFDIEICDAKE